MNLKVPFIDIINNKVYWKDKIAYLLLFLFPIAGMSVRHWISAIFTFLVLLSFSYLTKNGRSLVKEEKILLWIFFAFFVVFLVSALVNGWTERQTKYLGVEVRYLFFIPVYMMIRRLPEAVDWLLRGCIVGGVALGIQAYYSITVVDRSGMFGIYGPNLTGPYAVLMAFWLVISLNICQKLGVLKYMIPVSVMGALFSVAMSGSRGAYVGLFGLIVASGFFIHKKKTRVLYFILMIFLVVGAYQFIPKVSERIDMASNEIPALLEKGTQGGRLGSVGARIEMWRTSWLFIPNNPVLGIGRGNYEALLPEYLEKGYVNSALKTHGIGHLHNAYLEILVSKGIVGLAAFLLMLGYPFFFFTRYYKLFPEKAMLGIVLILGFSLFSITDASTFIKGNYTSIFLLFLAVFFSHHVRYLEDQDSHLSRTV